MTHIMLDIETLGTKPGAAIVSIGACVFSQEGIGDTHYQAIDIKAGSNGLAWPTFDPGTIAWWMDQSVEARAVFKDSRSMHIVPALHGFRDWCHSHGETGIYLWCHGASFDAPIVEAAFEALWHKDQVPWKFWNIRCTRTLYDVAGVRPERTAGTQHNALDDAVAQAKAVIAGYVALGKTLSA